MVSFAVAVAATFLVDVITFPREAEEDAAFVTFVVTAPFVEETISVA